MRKSQILFCFFAVLLVSCGKQFTCECSDVSVVRIGNTVDTLKNSISETDRYKNQNEARLMCESTKIETSSPTLTANTTCKLK